MGETAGIGMVWNRTGKGRNGLGAGVVVLALWLVLALASVAFGGEGKGGDLPVLPSAMWESLRGKGCSTMVRLDWQAVIDLPPVAAVLDSGRPESLRGVPVAGLVVKIAARVPLLRSGHVTEVWIQDGGLVDGAAKAVWAKTDLPASAIQDRLRAARWWSVPEDTGWLAEPLSEHDRQWIERCRRRDPSGKAVENATRMLLRWRWRARPLDGGWMLLSRGPLKLSVSDGLTDLNHAPDLGRAGHFPWKGLLEPMDGVLAAAALDNAKNDVAAGTAGVDGSGPAARGEETRIRAKIRQLEGESVRGLERQVGDVLIRVTEVDGGLAADMEARMPQGAGPGLCTERVARMAVQMGVIATMLDAPELSREIAGPAIRVENDRVEGALVVSMATLMDATNTAIQRRTDLARLYRKLREGVVNDE